jgi:hypothetical protein
MYTHAQELLPTANGVCNFITATACSLILILASSGTAEYFTSKIRVSSIAPVTRPAHCAKAEIKKRSNENYP